MSLPSHQGVHYPVYEGIVVRNTQHDARCLLEALRTYGLPCPSWHDALVPRLLGRECVVLVEPGQDRERDLLDFIATGKPLVDEIKERRTRRRAAARRIRQKLRAS